MHSTFRRHAARAIPYSQINVRLGLRPGGMPMVSELLSTHQAAQILGLAATTLDTWRSKRGRITRDGLNGPRFLRIGRTIRYTRTDLEDWIALHPAFTRNVG